jgi:hypothetical protein
MARHQRFTLGLGDAYPNRSRSDAALAVSSRYLRGVAAPDNSQQLTLWCVGTEEHEEQDTQPLTLRQIPLFFDADREEEPVLVGRFPRADAAGLISAAATRLWEEDMLMDVCSTQP